MRAKSTFFFAVVALMLATVVVCGCSTIGGNTTENTTAEQEEVFPVSYEDLWRNEAAYVGRLVSIGGKVISDNPYKANGRQVGNLRVINMYAAELTPENPHITDKEVYVIYRPNGTRYMSGDFVYVIGEYKGVTVWEYSLLKEYLGDATFEVPEIRAHIIYLVTEDGEKKSYVS